MKNNDIVKIDNKSYRIAFNFVAGKFKGMYYLNNINGNYSENLFIHVDELKKKIF